MRDARGWGVDALITDRPDLLVPLLRCLSAALDQLALAPGHRRTELVLTG